MNKKEFYQNLKKIGRDIRHGILCRLVCFDPNAECDCYWANIEDSDVEKVSFLMKNKKISFKRAFYELSKNNIFLTPYAQKHNQRKNWICGR